VPERGWGFATIESMNEQIAKGLVLFRKDHTQPPFRKSYLGSSPETPWDIGDPEEAEDDQGILGAQVMPSVIHKQAQVSVKLLRDIFKGRKTFENPKDHEVILRLIRYVTRPGDIILDSFAGSGTAGHAVLQLNKEEITQRRFVLVELDPVIAKEITRERILRVAEGYANSKGEIVEGLGGGFRFCELGEPLFDETGRIRDTVRFCDLARHVYFTETGEPIPRERIKKSPLLGITSNGVAVYLLYNGILEDKSVNGGNILMSKTLALLPQHSGPKVVYAAGSRLSNARLKREGITFKQTPYAIKLK
jgi:adenine-specific DNA-methyltransferase